MEADARDEWWLMMGTGVEGGMRRREIETERTGPPRWGAVNTAELLRHWWRLASSKCRQRAAAVYGAASARLPMYTVVTAARRAYQ